MVTIGNPWLGSPTPGYEWQAITPERRIAAVVRVVSSDAITVISASRTGRVILTLPDNPAAETGTVLRGVQKRLQEHLDPALRVYLEVKPDMNSLRRLRGVEIAE